MSTNAGSAKSRKCDAVETSTCEVCRTETVLKLGEVIQSKPKPVGKCTECGAWHIGDVSIVDTPDQWAKRQVTMSRRGKIVMNQTGQEMGFGHFAIRFGENPPR